MIALPVCSRLCLYVTIAWIVGFSASSQADIVISEILGNPRDYGASEGITDEDAGPDNYGWLEISNTGSTTADLGGWHLTDDPASPMKWEFPSPTNVLAGEQLVILASGLTTTSGNYIHLPFKLSKQGEYLAITDSSGNFVDGFAPQFPKQFLDHSYGRDATDSLVYFEIPSPGASNAASGLIDRVDRPDFSLAAGFYEGTVSVEITSNTPGATIRYTLDGTVPTPSIGNDYSAPLVFSGQSVATVRARAFRSDYIDSRVATATYLMNQPEGIEALPAISLVGEPSDYEAPDGILANPDSSEGRENEKLTSFEFIHQANASPPGQVDLGVRIVDNRSRASDLLPPDLWDFSQYRRPKFNLFLRNDYEANTWDYDLFPRSKVKNIDRMRIRLGHQDFPNPFIIDEFSRRMFVRMGHVNAVGLIVGLYQNGIFRAHVNLVERHRENFFQESFDSDFEWDVRHNTGSSDITEGDEVAWEAFTDFLSDEDLTDSAKYSEVLTMIDMVNYVDYLLLNTYMGARDWPQNNNDISRERSPNGVWRFHIWDNEDSLDRNGADVNTNTFTSRLDDNYGDIAKLWEEFSVLDEFKLLFADRVQHHMFNGGAMVESVMDEEWNTLSDELTPFLKFWEDDVDAEVDDLFGDWAALRRPIYFGHLEGKGLWPDTEAPNFSQHGGVFTGSTDIIISNPNSSGTIYYTTDGSDPRLIGGAVGSGATAYSAAVTISAAVTLNARVLDGGEWSPILSAEFFPSNPPELRVTELMYHPNDPTASEMLAGITDADLFEFIEVRNVGGSVLDLAGVAFTSGIVFEFDSASVTSLAAGERALLVRDPTAFTLRYGSGLPVIGTYSGGLKNSSEAITLTAAGGVTVLDFTYKDSWFPSTDGGGFSLEIVDDSVSTADWNLAASWRTSDAVDGSPGGANGVGPLPQSGDVIINEILTNTTSTEGDWIELYNTTTSDIDIGGWFLSDDLGTPMKFRIDTGTIISAEDYIVFTANSHFGPTSSHSGKLIAFGLSSAGDEVVLSSGSSGVLTGYQESEDFAGADPEVTFGQTPRADGSTPFTALVIPSKGAANHAPRVDSVVISEIHYTPDVGGYEFLEITNRSSEVVPLFDSDNPSNTWQMTDGISYTFPVGVSLQPGCHIILVPFDPVTQSVEFNDFMTLYQVPPGVGVLGPYTGALSNSGERVTLSRPGTPDPMPPNTVPMIVADSVKYNDVSPWPTEPAGGGASLDRIVLGDFGDDAVNWQSDSELTPGDGPADGFGEWLQNHFSLADLADPLQQAFWKGDSDVDNDGVSLLHEYFYGLDPNAPTSDDGLEILPEGSLTKIAYRRAKMLSGITLVIMFSDDNMITWAPIDYTGSVVSDEGTYDMMEATIMKGSDDQNALFFRLDVTRP